jgi:hypothetical protein
MSLSGKLSRKGSARNLFGSFGGGVLPGLGDNPRSLTTAILRHKLYLPDHYTEEDVFAVLIQRRFRLLKIVFEVYGSQIFCRKDGSYSAFGQVAFPSAHVQPKPYIVVSDTASPVRAREHQPG